MSDEAAVFFNAFQRVFPESTAKKYLCRWHIFRTWKKYAKNEAKLNVRVKKIDSSEIYKLRGKVSTSFL
ncbi:hypothetical protein CRE_13226 [Caenorhabditis remanei]|nr:hypothetical protein CRE_13226 [Caenorhabditis remanei]